MILDYSIIVPVFNKAGLTRNCLQTLPPTLEGAGEGETIVVDNASTDETPEMLAEFPWIRAIRNERNLGFAGANNQAAREARGKYLVLLNNDTQGLPGWLAAMLRTAREPGVGVVGARLLYPNDTIQHAGVVIAPVLFGSAGLAPYHYAWKGVADAPNVTKRREYQIVTGACMVVERELYLRLGGLDEIYWNGYEDVDFCLRVRGLGLKVVYDPSATLYHFESQSGVQRFRKTAWNILTLADRWTDRVALDSNARNVANGEIPVLQRDQNAAMITLLIPTPPSTVIVHGELDAAGREAFESSLRDCASPISAVEFVAEADAVRATRAAMRVRGERFVVLLDARVRLKAGWLDELVAQSAAPTNVAAVTFVPELPTGENVASLGTDARCTLLSLKQFPQHVELRDFDTIDGAVADLLLRAVAYQRGTRGASFALGTVPPAGNDPAFEAAWGRPLSAVFDTDPAAAETMLRARPVPPRGLASIVMLSWNAPGFTQKALESIRSRTSEPYEVIVVDNGSGPETIAMLRAIDDPHVRVVYNADNRGYAGGNNDGIAVARGDYVVLLNNDVIVTDGWLEGLLDPFRRFPGIGVTAPRSNKVVGHQQLGDARYDSEAAMAAFAARRRERNAERGYFADRAIGLCLCVDRTVLEQIGGFDERFALGNFEDDDFCIRVRAAGYAIFICDDVFIHHFGSASFAANNVDYRQTMHRNWTHFAQKWGYPLEFPETGYQPRRAFAGGFDRERHYVAIATADAEPEAGDIPEGVGVAFLAGVRD
ncbi:MAG: glycosyltransferase, partial [Candidatus Eremiobacteraeota bacterium]|nr:glycosyltransferase [Candidatus Eremiobacteraeota bacterium]